MTGIVIVKGGY